MNEQTKLTHKGIFIEIDPMVNTGRVRAGVTDNVVKKSKEDIDEAIEMAKEVAGSAAQQLQDMDFTPDVVTIEIGVKFRAEASAVVSKIAAEANMKVTLTWNKNSPA